jgi:serine/threonine protein phosphatase PrpC
MVTAKTNEWWYHASANSTAIFFYHSPATEFHTTDTGDCKRVLCFLDACNATTTAAAATKTGVATTDATAKDGDSEQWIGQISELDLRSFLPRIGSPKYGDG